MSGIPINAIVLVDFTVGASPEVCADSIVRLARKLECPVKGDFNGTPVIAYPGQSIEDVLRYFGLSKAICEQSEAENTRRLPAETTGS